MSVDGPKHAPQAQLGSLEFLGEFDNELLEIRLAGAPPASGELKDLPADRYDALRHERHHYYHALSTAVGIELLSSHLQDADSVATWKFQPSAEEHVQLDRANTASAAILRRARFRSRLWLAGYWREIGPAYGRQVPPEAIHLVTSIGRLNTVEGKQSTWPVCLARFVYAHDDALVPIARIPIGGAALFEHLVRLPDLLAAYRYDGADGLARILDESYTGEKLEYSVIAHIVANRTGIPDLARPFLVATVIAHIACLYPSEWTRALEPTRRVLRDFLRRWTRGRTDLDPIAHAGLVAFMLAEDGAPAIREWAVRWPVNLLAPMADGEPALREMVTDLVTSLLGVLGVRDGDLLRAGRASVDALERQRFGSPLVREIRDRVVAAAREVWTEKTGLAEYIALDLTGGLRVPTTPTVRFADGTRYAGTLIARPHEDFLRYVAEVVGETLTYPYTRDIVV